MTINGVNLSTTPQELERRFGKPKFSTQLFTHYVRGNQYIDVHRYDDGTCELEGAQLEINGKAVAFADGKMELPALERILKYRAKKISTEHDAEWFEFTKHSVIVGVGTRGTRTGKIVSFSLNYRSKK